MSLLRFPAKLLAGVAALTMLLPAAGADDRIRVTLADRYEVDANSAFDLSGRAEDGRSLAGRLESRPAEDRPGHIRVVILWTDPVGHAYRSQALMPSPGPLPDGITLSATLLTGRTGTLEPAMAREGANTASQPADTPAAANRTEPPLSGTSDTGQRPSRSVADRSPANDRQTRPPERPWHAHSTDDGRLRLVPDRGSVATVRFRQDDMILADVDGAGWMLGGRLQPDGAVLWTEAAPADGGAAAAPLVDPLFSPPTGSQTGPGERLAVGTLSSSPVDGPDRPDRLRLVSLEDGLATGLSDSGLWVGGLVRQDGAIDWTTAALEDGQDAMAVIWRSDPSGDLRVGEWIEVSSSGSSLSDSVRAAPISAAGLPETARINPLARGQSSTAAAGVSAGWEAVFAAFGRATRGTPGRPRTAEGCAPYIDAARQIAMPRSRSIGTDHAGRPLLGRCSPDPATDPVPLIRTTDGCGFLLRPSRGLALEASRLLHDSDEIVVEVAGCAHRAGDRAFDLEWTNRGCGLHSNWQTASSTATYRWGFVVPDDDGGAPQFYGAGRCEPVADASLDHVYESCAPLEHPTAGQIDRMRIVVIDAHPRILVDCQPQFGVAHATDEGCQGVWDHDLDGGETFATRRWYVVTGWMTIGEGESVPIRDFVTECVRDPSESWPHRRLRTGWDHDDSRRQSWPVAETRVALPDGDHLVSGPEIDYHTFHPMTYRRLARERRAIPERAPFQVGCETFSPHQEWTQYSRLDGSTVWLPSGPAEPVGDDGCASYWGPA